MSDIVIKKAGKKGSGVFANKDFKKGDIILQFDYGKVKKFYTREDIPKLTERQQNHLDYFGRGKYVLGYSAWFRVNHSCDPNAFIKPLSAANRAVAAKRNITKGEEVTIDYGAFPNDKKNKAAYERIDCFCGSKKCRGAIF